MPGKPDAARQAFPAQLGDYGARLNAIETWIRSTGNLAALTIAAAWRSTAQNLGKENWTQIKVDKALYDPHGLVDLVNGRYVVPATGIYSVAGSVAGVNVGANQTLIVAFWKNGTTEVVRGERTTMPVVGQLNTVVAGTAELLAGDHLELYAFSSTNGEPSLEIAQIQNRFDVFRVA